MRHLQLPQGEVRVYPNSEVLAEAAAGEFVRLARQAIAAQGRFAVALAGGSTPRAMYSKLAAWESVPWSRIHFFFGDERCVPPDHPDSNFGMANAALFSKIPIPADNLHRMEAELAGFAAATRYQEELGSFFGLTPGQFPCFDLILLGMGPDGHTASLFPGTAALEEARLAVTSNRVPQSDTDRITLTFPALNAARQIIFLVAGEGKTKVLGEVLGLPVPPARYPVQRVQSCNGRVLWMVDEAASVNIQDGIPAPLDGGNSADKASQRKSEHP